MNARAWRWLRLALLLVLAACSRPLPDESSPGALVYVQQCGLCHPPHHPGLMKAEMWKVQVARMAEIRARRGLPPLSPTEEKLILDYLTRHSG
ncbi:MAG TPA: hypothetical protein VIS07_18940 [Candidatus Binatia bacterium]